MTKGLYWALQSGGFGAMGVYMKSVTWGRWKTGKKASLEEGLSQLGKLHANPLRACLWGRGSGNLVWAHLQQDSHQISGDWPLCRRGRTPCPRLAQKSPALNGHPSCHYYLPDTPSASFPLRPWSLQTYQFTSSRSLKIFAEDQMALGYRRHHPWCFLASREDTASRVAASLPWKTEKSHGLYSMGVHSLLAFWYCTGLSCVPEGT